jgi:hypothetical protein
MKRNERKQLSNWGELGHYPVPVPPASPDDKEAVLWAVVYSFHPTNSLLSHTSDFLFLLLEQVEA